MVVKARQVAGKTKSQGFQDFADPLDGIFPLETLGAKRPPAVNLVDLTVDSVDNSSKQKRISAARSRLPENKANLGSVASVEKSFEFKRFKFVVFGSLSVVAITGWILVLYIVE